MHLRGEFFPPWIFCVCDGARARLVVSALNVRFLLLSLNLRPVRRLASQIMGVGPPSLRSVCEGAPAPFCRARCFLFSVSAFLPLFRFPGALRTRRRPARCGFSLIAPPRFGCDLFAFLSPWRFNRDSATGFLPFQRTRGVAARKRALQAAIRNDFIWFGAIFVILLMKT